MGVVKERPRILGSVSSRKRQSMSGAHRNTSSRFHFLKNMLVTTLQWHVKCFLISLLTFCQRLVSFLKNSVYGVYVYRSASAHRGERGTSDTSYRGAGVTGRFELLDAGAENPLGSSRRVVCVLNCRAISPALYRIL